jgi:hypothetical protein
MERTIQMGLGPVRIGRALWRPELAALRSGEIVPWEEMIDGIWLF